VSVLLLLTADVLVALNRDALHGGVVAFYLVFSVGTAAYATAGALVATRVPRNPLGWILSAVGLALALAGFGEQYGVRTLLALPGSLPAGALVVSSTEWMPGSALVGIPLVFLLFPSGRVPSPRWRWVLRALLVTLVVGGVAKILTPVTNEGAITNALKDHHVHPANTFGVAGLKGVLDVVLAVSGALGLIAGFLAIVALFWRRRRADPEEREQIRWLAFVAIAFLVMAVIMAGLSPLLSDNSSVGTWLWVITVIVGFGGIPLAVGIAVMKYRLYDIDVVINKTVVFGALAAFITAVYVGIVVGIGELIGQGTSKPNLGLSIVATAVVAVAFQPVRSRVQHFANRLVYGERATPYEVLSEFGHRMAGTYADDDVLSRMARILGEGTGAKEARVWLGVSGRLTPAATWPDTDSNGSAPTRDDADLVVPVSHQGDELGALSIKKAPGERLTPAEEKLTNDLASQTGLVLRNVKLIEDLKASRVRLVQAQDEERRKIERNIHDGAQQQLVALQVKLGLARQFASNPDQLDPLLTQLQEETNQALQELRDLARGIYPPLLADQGLTVALSAQARKAPIPVTVESDSIGRYPQDIEAAVYFCTLEALQNVAKYAGASHATVRLAETAGRLTFEVTDDGTGFDTSVTSYGTGLQGMADRLAAQGGGLAVRSTPGRGTTVTGQLPVRVLEQVG
jgi:signal transduction histidine kinase